MAVSQPFRRKMNIASIFCSIFAVVLFIIMSKFDVPILESPNRFAPYSGYVFLFLAIVFAVFGVKHSLNKWAWISFVCSLLVQLLFVILIMGGV